VAFPTRYAMRNRKTVRFAARLRKPSKAVADILNYEGRYTRGRK